MKVGYVRVSTAEQNTVRQEELMRQLGVERMFIDKASGKNSDRPALQEMLVYLREGDTLIVSSIDRLARNTKDLLDLIELLNSKGVKFISQKEQLDTSTTTGKFMLTIFSAVAELERDSIRQRQAEGIAIAKREGKYHGRPEKPLDQLEEIYQQWKNKKITATEASRQLGISRSTFYRRIEQFEDNEEIVLD